MSDTVYRLMERHQKLDVLLTQARARRFPNALELVRLHALKLALRRRLGNLMGRSNRMPAHC